MPKRKKLRKRKPAKKKPKKLKKFLTLAVIVLMAVLIVRALSILSAEEFDRTYTGRFPPQPYLGGFCGTSTFGPCDSDADCYAGGCSGELCQSKNEEPIGTPCWWKDCFRDEDYGVTCQCVDNQCQWTK